MFWQKRGEPFQDIVGGALNAALAIDLQGEQAFENCPLNNLEALIAIFWMVERSLWGLPDRRRQTAGNLMFDSLIEWLGESYSSHEIGSLVIPAFRKRVSEYSASFVIRKDEPAAAPLMRTFKAVVENVFGEEEAHIAQIFAAIEFWWKPISAEGARITEIDKRGSINWS